MPKSTPAQLDRWASKHIRYEVQMLVAGAIELSRYERIPPAGGFERPTIDDALLEATLVHLRLLDDFLRNKGDDRDIKAKLWVSGTFKGIDPAVWDLIGGRVAHLAKRRDDPTSGWDIRGMAFATCAEMSRFIEAVEVAEPERSSAFDLVREEVEHGLRALRP